jgi:hypothetical protein
MILVIVVFQAKPTNQLDKGGKIMNGQKFLCTKILTLFFCNMILKVIGILRGV